MKKTLTAASFAALTAAIATPAVAADTYAIDGKHTFPVFAINHLGFSVQHGRFDKTSGTITLDAAAKKGSIDLSIDTASINMGFEDWNKHMRSADFFNAEKFPTMTYKSDKLVFKGEKVVGAEGTLTLLGVSKPVKLAVTGFHCGTHPMTKAALCGANVTATIKRSEFGLSAYVPAVADEVQITVPVEAYRQ